VATTTMNHTHVLKSVNCTLKLKFGNHKLSFNYHKEKANQPEFSNYTFETQVKETLNTLQTAK